MKAHLLLISAGFLLFGLVSGVQASGSSRSDQYATVSQQAAQDQINGLKNGRATPKEMGALSEKMHGVTVLNVYSTTGEIAEPVVPQGELQLNKVVIVDPKSN